MNNLKFKQNDFLNKNNFSKILKKEIDIMMKGYMKRYYLPPISFETFDKNITDLVIKISDEVDVINEQQKKRNKERKRRIKHCKVNTNKYIFKKTIK